MIRTFDVDTLMELLDCDKGEEVDGCIFIKLEENISKSRWTAKHRVIFLFEDKLWASEFTTGLTESVETRPYENDKPEAYEVEQYEITVTRYKRKID